MKTIVVYRQNQEDANSVITILGVTTSKEAAIQLATADANEQGSFEDPPLEPITPFTWEELTGEGFYGNFDELSWHAEEHELTT